METLKRPTRIKPSFAFEDLRFENICFQTKKTLRNQEVKLLFCSLSEKHEKDRETCEKYQFTDFYCVLLKKKSFCSEQSVGAVLKNIHQKPVHIQLGFAHSDTAGESH